MKSNNVFLVSLVMSLFFVISCDKNELNLNPLNSINCEQIGLGENHAKNDAYQQVLNSYVSSGFPGISAAIYTPQEGLWVGAAGLSDIKNRIAMNTCNTLFSGSVAKLYTVTSAMILYEQGKLDLDAKISKFLHQEIVDNLPNGKTATIRQLMNHSAGMPDHDNEKDLENWSDAHNGKLPSAADQLAYLYDNEPLFEPGTAVRYSSAHTLTLSLVLDSIAQRHHSTIISEEIIQKLGLTETYYKNEAGYPMPKNLVRGYVDGASNNEDISEYAINYCLGSQGDAGIIATAHDYFLFIKGLVEGEIVNQTTVDTMLTPMWAAQQGDVAVGFGLGFFIGQKDQEYVKIGHSGSTAGGMSHVYYYPKSGAYLVVLTNTIAIEDQKLSELWAIELLLGTGNKNITSELETLMF